MSSLFFLYWIQIANGLVNVYWRVCVDWLSCFLQYSCPTVQDRPGFSTVFRFKVYYSTMYFIENVHKTNFTKSIKSHLSWIQGLFVCDTKEWINELWSNVLKHDYLSNATHETRQSCTVYTPISATLNIFYLAGTWWVELASCSLSIIWMSKAKQQTSETDHNTQILQICLLQFYWVSSTAQQQVVKLVLSTSEHAKWR